MIPCPLVERARRGACNMSERFVRTQRKVRFIRRNRDAIAHALSHWRHDFSFTAPIHVCQKILVERFRRAVPYGSGTRFRDVFYALWRAYLAFDRAPVKQREKRV